jgi:hypothetical protein
VASASASQAVGGSQGGLKNWNRGGGGAGEGIFLSMNTYSNRRGGGAGNGIYYC